MNIDIIMTRQEGYPEAFQATDSSPDTRRCTRCGGTLREGFLVESQPSLNFEPAAPTVWHEGPLSTPAWAGVQPEPRKQRKVVACRCDRCGVLEMFAP